MNRRNFLKSLGLGILNLTPLSAYAKNISNQKIVLSFDDVPYSLDRMKILVYILKKYGFLNSHFYLTGEGIKKHPDSVKYLISEGFVIGWHSMKHELMRNKNDTEFLRDVIEWKNLLKSIVPYYEPKFARFPYGAGSNKQQLLLKSEGLELLECARGKHPTNWDIDTLDWDIKQCYTKEKIIDKLNQIKINNCVILFHLELSNQYKSVKESLITSDLNEFEKIVSSIVVWFKTFSIIFIIKFLLKNQYL